MAKGRPEVAAARADWLPLIRELPAAVDVAIGTDTIACFLAEMNGDQILQQPAKRTG